jgi:hypothetical protein
VQCPESIASYCCGVSSCFASWRNISACTYGVSWRLFPHACDGLSIATQDQWAYFFAATGQLVALVSYAGGDSGASCFGGPPHLDVFGCLQSIYDGGGSPMSCIPDGGSDPAPDWCGPLPEDGSVVADALGD